MDFLYWLLTEGHPSASDAYQKLWAPHFQALEPQRKKYFSSWFPEGQERIYLPIKIRLNDFNDSVVFNNNNVKKQVQTLFEISGMFKILDWRKGFATDSRNNQWKIAKVLDYLAKSPNVVQQYVDRFTSGMSPAYKQNYVNQGISGIRDDYLNLKMRLNPVNDFLVVISQNANDIASMSTGRNWQSCNSLPLGGSGEKLAQGDETHDKEYLKKQMAEDPSRIVYHYIISRKNNITTPTRVDHYFGDKIRLKDGTDIPIEDIDEVLPSIRGKGYTFDKLADEVVEGGLVVYLISPEDKEIKSPYSRVVLKRYENNTFGNSILMCSDRTTYGITSDVLVRFIQKWLQRKQKSSDKFFGTYKRMGGNWISGDPYDIQKPIQKITTRNERKILRELETGDFQARGSLSHQVLKIIDEKGLDSVSKIFWKGFKKVLLKGELPEVAETLMGKILRNNPNAFTFKELLRSNLKRSDIRGVLNSASNKTKSTFGYGYDQPNTERDLDAEYGTFVKSTLDGMLKTKTSKINGEQFERTLDQLGTYDLEGGYFSNIIRKIGGIVSSRHVQPEVKTRIVQELLSGVRYGWTYKATPEDQREWMIIVNKILPKLLPYLSRWEKHDVEGLIKIMEEHGIKVHPSVAEYMQRIKR